MFNLNTKNGNVSVLYLGMVSFYLDFDLRLSLTGAELVGLATGKDLTSMVSEELQTKKKYFFFKKVATSIKDVLYKIFIGFHQNGCKSNNQSSRVKWSEIMSEILRW